MKSKRRNILFTFDYELFLGPRSGSVDKCLLEPTNRLIGMFERLGIKHAIFFVDTSYLIRLQAEPAKKCSEDFERIKEQLQRIIAKGHYIFPHIHPHWLDAEYSTDLNQWSLKNYSKYRFHKATLPEREMLFGKSMEILKNIIEPVDKLYKISGYRAGGWSIQPFMDFEPFFVKHGITNEFSVVSGFKNLADAQYFDFTNAPQKNLYKFDNDPVVESVNGKYTQYSISTLPISSSVYLLSKVWGKYLWKTGQRSIGDGIGVAIKDDSATGRRKETIGSSNKEMVSVELLTKVKLPLYKRFIKNRSYMHFISHPKMLSDHNFMMFEQFLKFAVSKFSVCTDFSHFNEVINAEDN